MSDSIAVSSVCSAESRFNRDAEALDDAAKTELGSAGESLKRAGNHAADSVANTAGAVVNLATAAKDTVEGSVRVVAAAGHLAAAGGIAAAGAVVRSAEEVASGARSVARFAARGFAGIANALSRVVGDGKSVTVRELESAPSTRVSDKLFAAAGRQLDASGASARASLNGYASAVVHLAGATVNVGLAAGHAAAVAGNVALAAVHTGEAAVIKTAEYGVRLGAAAVRAAKEGVAGARELAVLSARFSAATANLLARDDQGQIEVRAALQLRGCRAQAAQLIQDRPALQRFAFQLG